MSKTSLNVEWRQLDWKTIEKTVFKLQKRIYEAAKRCAVIDVHKLQKLLLKSWSARCLAVRRVTQDNRGKRTAGVDGIKNLTLAQRLKLSQSLELDTKSKPIRRVRIAKPGTDEKRLLGIPTMKDRALQALVKLALEPEWEARFEPNSYGFRPGRSCQDAREAIFICINHMPKYVLDADIAKCFDRINHDYLLNKLRTFPLLRRQVRAWLKAAIVDNGELFPSQEGTPQGGIVSPLLANIALHGLENAIREAFPVEWKYDRETRKMVRTRLNVNFIRYADDFVVMHSDLKVIQQCKEFISQWLKPIGLELKPSKTRLTHTLDSIDGEVGFNFLGFNIRQHRVSKRRRRQGYKTLIKPSKESIHKHVLRLREMVRTHRSQPQAALIEHLNPVIRGWCNYFASAVSSTTFQKLDYILYQQLWSWAKHSNKQGGGKRLSRKYWKTEGHRHWVFKTADGKARLYNHTSTKIRRHPKVKGEKSPYDGDWIYWANRQGRYTPTSVRLVKLLKIQKGKCVWCGLHFRSDDLLEVDHMVPKSQGGKDEYTNFQLLHGHCHDSKSSKNGN
jgi:RNA-directed DNA polymerase